MAEADAVFKKISGTFFRSVLADRVHQVLDAPGPASAGRYHRLGEPTLYTSGALEWSIQAVAGYMREDRLPRVVVPLKITDAMVLDQHDEEACKRLGVDRSLSNESWRTALSEGREPASWRNVDIARMAGADGIIDRSRMISGGWHLNLFRWNKSGGPLVEVCGDPVEIVLTPDGAKWAL
jgi:RES domain-containing protein